MLPRRSARLVLSQPQGHYTFCSDVSMHVYAVILLTALLVVLWCRRWPFDIPRQGCYCHEGEKKVNARF